MKQKHNFLIETKHITIKIHTSTQKKIVYI